MIKNIFLTGEKQVGKSTLINRLVEDMQLELSGFRTLPYTIENERMGFYLNSLIPLDTYRNNMPISIQNSPYSCFPVTETFNTLGVEILKNSMENAAPVILMDELGRLERMAAEFNREVKHVLSHKKLVLGVLQQTSTPLLDEIKNRQDTIVLTLTRANSLQVYMQIKKELERTLRDV